jgi:hypothetical protein
MLCCYLASELVQYLLSKPHPHKFEEVHRRFQTRKMDARAMPWHFHLNWFYMTLLPVRHVIDLSTCRQSDLVQYFFLMGRCWQLQIIENGT